MNLSAALVGDILPRVEKPGRYLGTEHNVVGPRSKSLADVRVRLALVFPDLYDLGLGNLGLHILYALLNRLPHVWAERVYAPAPDLEALLRAGSLPLWGLESRDSLDVFDGIGFTLQSELTYTNILNILDLARLPLRTRDRREHDPLTFAGGPSVFNPEPLSPFLDFFVMGDGEDVVLEVAEVFDAVRDRRGRLEALAGIEGIYVPALYPTERLPDGRVLPSADAARVRKRIVADLGNAPAPVDYIVPFTRQVHDRVSLEVLRGCTQGCRFCQAGLTTRPVRERTIDQVTDLLDRTLASTGYEEVSLVSLSTCDHSEVRQLVDRVVRRAAPERVGVSLPSLRLDSFSVDLADMVSDIRRTGLTFAPEAASPRLRALINKWIPDEDLLAMSGRAYELGWDHVKLYFMVGLPTERDDDIDAIADLALRTLALGRQHNRRASVNLGVSTFVPKPFTPFQWEQQIDRQETSRRQGLLMDRLGRRGGVKFGRHDPDETWIEGLVTRSDRSAGDLLEAAWREGCRFDAWNEHRDTRRWERAIAASGFDAAHALRERTEQERLPWDHVDVFVDKQWLLEDRHRAMELQHALDCRHSKCHRCGVIDEKRDLCAHMLRTSIAGRKTEAGFERAPPPPELGGRSARPGEPPARVPELPVVQRLLFRVGITGEARFLAHLECVNAWVRAMRRAQFPLAWSEGFHPHPRLAFSGARPLGEETVGDWMDVLLNRRSDPTALLAALQKVLPAGMHVFEARGASLSAPGLMSLVQGADYLFLVDQPPEDPAGRLAALLAGRLAALLERDEVLVDRRAKGRQGKGQVRQVDIRPHLRSLVLGESSDVPEEVEGSGDRTVIRVSLDMAEGRGARPSEVIRELGLDALNVRVVRLGTRIVGI